MPRYLLSVCIAIAVGFTTQGFAQAAKTPAPVAVLQVPPAEAQLILIRSTLIALSQANKTNNYSVLNTLGSPTFRSSNPTTRLTQVFESFRANNIDLSPVTLVMPQATQPPKIENGRLRLIGLFPTQPMQVRYDLMYEPVAGVWQLFGLAVNLDKAALAQK
jgi:hypothetical protein